MPVPFRKRCGFASLSKPHENRLAAPARRTRRQLQARVKRRKQLSFSRFCFGQRSVENTQSLPRIRKIKAEAAVRSGRYRTRTATMQARKSGRRYRRSKACRTGAAPRAKEEATACDQE